MPPVIAFIKAGITFIATAGAAGSAMAALTIVTTTLSFAATRMIKNKLNFSVDDNDRSRQTTVRSTTEPRKLVYGETMVSGPLTYAQVSGANNKYLHQVVALAGHELTQISKVFLDDKSIDLTNSAIYDPTQQSEPFSVRSGFFGPKNNEAGSSETIVYIDTRIGTASQTAYAGLRSDLVTSQEYLSTHRGDNVASLYTRWTINEGSREVWDEVGNVQNIKALVKGKKIYDPRLEVAANGGDAATAGDSPTNASYVVYDNDTLSTASIDRGEQGRNPALMIADYLMDDEFGLGIPSSKMDWAAIIAAADDCDTLVPIPNSATQKRFFGSGVIFGADPYAKSIEKILSGMNGSLVYSQGKYIVRAGVYVAPTESITEDDIIGEVDIRTAIPRSDRLNQIKGLFIDPTEQYKMMEFGPVTVSGAISRDNGEVLEEEIKLPFTDNRYAAQRIAFKQVNQSFLQTMITVPVNLKGMRIAVGDRVNVYLSDLESVDSGNWNPKIFKCINWSFAENGSGGINLTLIEDAQTRYADPSATGGPNNSGDYSTITAQGVIARNLPDVPAPTNFSITAAINSIELNWDNPSNALAWEQIWVYRSTSSTTPTDSATPIVKFRGTSYTDQRAADGTEYYYWIQAVRYPQGSTPASGTNTSKSVMVASSPVKIAATKIGNAVMGANSVDTTQIVDDAVGSAKIGTTIQSDNWVSSSGAAGRQINKAGSATFQTATIKGGITATSGAIGGLTIGSDKVYVGTGTFNNANTAFYVDDQGQLSLKDKLSWDGTDLTISGSVTATSGTFTGTVNASAGAFTGDVSTNSKFIAGSSEDVAVVDGGDSLYRFYAGHSNPTNAAFRVDKDGHIDATNIRIYDTNGQVILDDSGLHGVGLGNISADSGVGVAEVAGRLDDNADEITFTTSSSNEVYTFQPKVQIDINQDAGSGESPSTSNLSFAGADQSAVTTIIGQVKLIVEYFVKTSSGSYSGTPTATQEFTFVSGTSANSSQLGVSIFTLNSRGAGVVYANIGASEAISDPSIAGARTFVKSSADLTFANAGTYNIKVNARIATLAGTTLTTSTTPALDASATTGTGVILGTDETQSSLEDFRRLYTIKPASGNTKTIIASTTDDTFSSTSGSSLLTTGGTISGSLVVTGDLTVQGTTTTVDTDNLTVKDNNITLNYSTGDSSSTANNAGITIQDAVNSSTDATLLWKTASDTFDFSHKLKVPDVEIDGQTLTSSNNLDSLSDGFYKWANSQPTNAPAQYMVMYQMTDPNQKIQIAWGASTNGKLYIRRADNGTFYAWTQMLTTASASSTYLPLSGGTLTGSLAGTTISASGSGGTTPIIAASGQANLHWAGRFENTHAAGYGLLGITASNSVNQSAFEIRKNTSDQAMLIKADGTFFVNYAAAFSSSIASDKHTITSTGTIGGATVANGYLKITDSTNTLALDPNEIHTTSTLYILSEEEDIYFRGLSNAGVILRNGTTQFMDASRNLTNIGAITSSGVIKTTQNIQSGDGSGGVALTINDGYGNANVTWNHENGTPEQDGNAARIEVNTDSTSGASMSFELLSNVSSGVTVQTTNVFTLTESAARLENGKTLNIGDYGKIGSVATDRIYIATNDGLGLQLDKDNNRIVPVTENGSTYNNNVSFGTASLPFKNLFLSANIDVAGRILLNGGAGGTALLDVDDSASNDWAGRFENSSSTGYGLLAITASNSSSQKAFEVRKNTSDQAMLIKADGSFLVQYTATFNNNVGIGTSSPVRPLSVKASQEQLTLSEGDSRGATFDYRSSTGNLNIATNGINARTNPQFTLDLNGNVSIGHASPTAILDVRRGDASGKIAEFHTSTGYGIEIGSSQADAYISSGYAQKFQFKTGTTATPRITIDSSGSVGFGTINPRRNIHLHNSSSATTKLMITNGATGESNDGQGFQIGIDSSGNALVENRENTNLTFYTNNSPRMTITSSGNSTFSNNVGIGRDPRVALDVAGEVAIAYNATYGLRFYNNAQNNWSSIGNTVTGSSSANLVFKDASGEAMRLDGSRNILVGKTSLDYEGTAGHILRNDGLLHATRSGGNVTDFNRLGGGNGEIVRLSLDGATIGTIGVYNSAPYLQSGSAASYTGLYFNTNKIEPVGDVSNDVRTDATVDLGSTSNRFKALHLSGTANIPEVNVGRGVVYLESNSNGSNDSGAGVTLRTSSNPSGNGSIFDVRSSGQATRLYVGQELTSSGINPFYVGNSNSITNNGVASNYSIELLTNGSITAEGNITAYGSASDIRLKENIETIPNALDKIKSLTGVTFNYKKDGSRSTGVIAQEVQKVLPEVIYETSEVGRSEEQDSSFLAVRYGQMMGLAIEAIKDLSNEIDELKNKIKELKNGD